MGFEVWAKVLYDIRIPTEGFWGALGNYRAHATWKFVGNADASMRVIRGIL